jgi:L-gulonate 3-dehydrogenase
MLAELEAHGLLDGQLAQAVGARIAKATTLKEALADAAYVQECAPEKVELKAQIFDEMDGLTADGAVLASSTSIILPSLFTGHMKRRSQAIVVHPLNPPHLIPAVEIVPAPWTSKETIDRAREIVIGIGQKPVLMMKEIDGFLMNRLQGALLEECFRLFEGGYASAEDIDVALKDGLAMRWSFIGPFETAELNAPGGIRDYVNRYDRGYQVIRKDSMHRADWTGKTLDRIEAERRALLPADKIKERQEWRDRKLMELAAFRRR